jgi:excisionase family DNA binding protein
LADTEGGRLSGLSLFIHVRPNLREAAFLRPAEAAELTGLSTRAIYRAIERGELRAARLCSRLRIPRAAFEEWVEACAVRRAEPAPVAYPRVPPPATGSFRSLLARREETSS